MVVSPIASPLLVDVCTRGFKAAARAEQRNTCMTGYMAADIVLLTFVMVNVFV